MRSILSILKIASGYKIFVFRASRTLTSLQFTMPESISSTGSGEQLFFLITFMLKLKNDLAVKKKKQKKNYSDSGFEIVMTMQITRDKSIFVLCQF